MRTFLVIGLFLATAFAGCTEETPPPTTKQCPAIDPHSLSMSNHTNTVVMFDTSKGCFAIELFLDKAPITAGNFLNLTKSGYYNGTRFHRVIDDFMIQDGDPNSKDTSKRSTWGQGGPSCDLNPSYPCKNGQYAIPDEYRPDLRHSGPGILSMANSGPGTGGSQYFITLTATPHLDAYAANGEKKQCSRTVSCHAVFGKVVYNMNIVDAIGNVETDCTKEGADSRTCRDVPTEDVVNKGLKVL